MTMLARVMVVIAVATGAAWAWRLRGHSSLARPVGAVAIFLIFGLAADITRELLLGAPALSAGWYGGVTLFLAQAATLPALALIVLANRAPWPAVIGLAVAMVVVAADARSVRWLYKAADIAAVAGATLCVGAWWRRDVQATIPAVVTMMIGAVAVASALLHAADYSLPVTWNYQAAATATVALAAAGLHIRGMLNDNTA